MTPSQAAFLTGGHRRGPEVWSISPFAAFRLRSCIVCCRVPCNQGKQGHVLAASCCNCSCRRRSSHHCSLCSRRVAHQVAVFVVFGLWLERADTENRAEAPRHHTASPSQWIACSPFLPPLPSWQSSKALRLLRSMRTSEGTFGWSFGCAQAL